MSHHTKDHHTWTNTDANQQQRQQQQQPPSQPRQAAPSPPPPFPPAGGTADGAVVVVVASSPAVAAAVHRAADTTAATAAKRFDALPLMRKYTTRYYGTAQTASALSWEHEIGVGSFPNWDAIISTTTKPSSLPSWDEVHSPPHHGTWSYYTHCAAGGIMASSIRWVLNPLEVVKGYAQVGYYPKHSGTWQNIARLYSEEGIRPGLFKGLTSTAVAYAIQTGTKYSLYEFFKDKFLSSSSPTHEELSSTYRGLVYVASAALAEACADVLMCPAEMVRVKIQTQHPQPAAVSSSGSSSSPSSFRRVFAEMWKQRPRASGGGPSGGGGTKFPFGALPPLWARQVPGTIMNFYTFENLVHATYAHLLTDPKESYGAATQLGVTLGCGYLAGFACAAVSHPADSLLSLSQQPRYAHMSYARIVRKYGFWKLATRGLVPRMIQVGTIVGVQWYIYDIFKTTMGMGTTGG